jgi:hypothetical protein
LTPSFEGTEGSRPLFTLEQPRMAKGFVEAMMIEVEYFVAGCTRRHNFD